MLSYLRETALQGALYYLPKVEDWNWETIFYVCRRISRATVWAKLYRNGEDIGQSFGAEQIRCRYKRFCLISNANSGDLIGPKT